MHSILWNIGVGATLVLTKNINFEVTYKYIDSNKIKGHNISTVNGSSSSFGGAFAKRNNIHEISGGLIINF